MKRVLALAVACLLVAAALAVRSALSSDDGDGDADGDGNGSGALVIACVPELREACEALDRQDAELRIEDPSETLADPDVDAWVTLDPWPAIAATSAGRDVFGEVMPVAQTDLVLLARERQVSGDCEPLSWTCLVDDLGDQVAVPNLGTASGLLVLGFAAVNFHDGQNLASNDFTDPAFESRLAALDIGGNPLRDIRDGLPEPAATGALAVQLARLGTRLDAFVQSPGPFPATVAVVVAGRDADRVAGEPSFTDALAELGWDVRDDAATSGLPRPDVLFALSQEA
jgi:hypothetical protein